MKNVTITVDEEVARWARIEAARRDTSVSRMVGDLLAEMMRAETRYESARDAFFAIDPVALSGTDDDYPRRDALYDRNSLR
ncbi:MAG: hypothetical protein PVG53_00130 [Holophagae bacterium]|jgi:hypothetical protein